MAANYARCSACILVDGQRLSVGEGALVGPALGAAGGETRAILFEVALESWLEEREDEDEQQQQQQQQPSAFARLMAAAAARSRCNHLPPQIQKEKMSGEERMFNKALGYMEGEGMGFSAEAVERRGRAFVKETAAAFFKLTMHEAALCDAHVPADCKAPRAFKQFCGLSQYDRDGSHKTRPQLGQAACVEAAALLLRLVADYSELAQPTWRGMHGLITGLIGCLEARMEMLQRPRPAAEHEGPGEHVQSRFPDISIRLLPRLPPGAPVKDKYSQLNQTVIGASEYVPIPLADYLPTDSNWLSQAKYKWMCGLQLQRAVYQLVHSPGGQLENQYWLVKAAADPQQREECLGRLYEAVESVRAQLAVVLSRDTQRAARLALDTVLVASAVNVPPPIRRKIVSELTGDQSAPVNAAQARIDEQVELAIETGGEFLGDMRRLNCGSNAKQDEFWAELETVLNDKATAAHARRHGPAGASYASEVLSVPLLIEEVAVQYTGRFHVQRQLQTRLLRWPHPHAHYGNALIKLLQEFAKLHAQHTIMLSVDDKAHVPIGEPALPVQAITRQRAVLAVSRGSALCWQWAGSRLQQAIMITRSTPRPRQDTVLNNSNCWTHAAELSSIIEPVVAGGKSIVLLLCDGGPDRHLERAAVQASHIALWRLLRLDVLTVVRTVPRQSWRNPVERCMSVLNLGLQGVALSRQPGDEMFEDEIKSSVNCMNNVRELATGDSSFSEKWAASVKGPLDTIAERFGCLQWSGKQIFKKPGCECQACAAGLTSPLRMSEEEYGTIHRLPLPRLAPLRPGDEPSSRHYQPFNELYGQEPDESDLPAAGARGVSGKKGGNTFSATAVRAIVTCGSCGKQRCVSSQSGLKPTQRRSMKIALGEMVYVCGSPLVPEGHELADVLTHIAVSLSDLSSGSTVRTVARALAPLAAVSTSWHDAVREVGN
eukprot:scaffold16.g44.t1